ncbi:MAG TPA: right-handed parallel beta-helix repeat-containing protein [Bacteroidota bacterium]|nr:right-handed parallel beta-helix repeat-containing protein [Bacteroidota bacterium]
MMRRITQFRCRGLFLPLVLTLPAIACPDLLAAAQGDTVTFFVSPGGNDGWSGRIPSSVANGDDGPFASLARARDAVRFALGHGQQPSVKIRGGVYQIQSTVKLDSAESGLPDWPVTWSAYEREDVRLTGGAALAGFHPVTDSAVLKRLSPEARTSVLVTDLRTQGIADFGTPPDRLNLFFRGKRMQVARYPYRGWLKIAEVPLIEGHILNQGDPLVLKEGMPAGRHSGMFRYGGDRPSRWAETRDVWMHGYWSWDWKDDYQKVARIDTAGRVVYPEPPYHNYGYQKGQRFCFLNVLEELDRPGEWVLDPEKGHLYFWPPAAPGTGDITVSMLKAPMIFIDGASHVLIERMTFECSRVRAIMIRGGSEDMIAGCTFRNIDNDTSVVIDGGRHNGIRSCDIEDVGSTGIRLAGGDRRTLTPGGNYAINNHIHAYGRILQAFNGAIYLEGVGDTLAHNRIHDAPVSGIQYYGNDHLIELNELYDLAHEAGDVGGINTGADYSEMGTVIRYNYIHDMHGPGEGGVRGIYLDLPGSNTTIVGNVIAGVDIGVFFNSGRDNRVENNIFYDCHPAIGIYRWPFKQYFRPGGGWRIYEKLHDIRYTEPPYSVRYPMLPRYLDSVNLGEPYGNSVLRNLSAGGIWLDLSEGMDFSRVRVENNVVGDSMVVVFTKKWTPDYDPYHIGYSSTHARSDSAMARRLRERGNILADPGFVDPARRDFRLKEDSPAWSAGFRKIPFGEIGLVADEFRATIPR